MRVVPSENVIGARIEDVDIGRLSDNEFAPIEAAFNKHAVICFPRQKLDEPQLIAFARRFGEVEKIFLTHYAHPQYPEIMYVSNIKVDGRDIGHADAGRVWHTDMSYTARPPRATILYALEVPFEDGVALGDTLFSSAADAHDALPAEKRERIAKLRALFLPWLLCSKRKAPIHSGCGPTAAPPSRARPPCRCSTPASSC